LSFKEIAKKKAVGAKLRYFPNMCVCGRTEEIQAKSVRIANLWLRFELKPLKYRAGVLITPQNLV
jgi:hypothetical protein